MSIIAKAKDYLGLIVAGVAVASIIIGGLQYFAKASDLKMVQLRLDQKIVFDQVMDVQKRIWTLEDRNREYGENCLSWPDDRDRVEYRELIDRLERLREREKALEKK
jgi:hypothetical protein